MSIYEAGFNPRPEDEREQEGWADSDILEDGNAPWRGDLHADDWPERDAGPEYWLYKKRLEEGEDKDAA